MEVVSNERAVDVALLSDLVKAVANVQGMEEVSVGIFARAAREAGFITQKGRGRGAAHMTTQDAANLLIAINGSALAKDVPSKIPQFRALELIWDNADVRLSRRAVKDLVVGHDRFGDQLESLIELAKLPRSGRSELDKRLRLSYRKTDAQYAKLRDIELPTPRLDIQFGLPIPVASIRLWSPGEAYKSRSRSSIPLREKAHSNYRTEIDEHDADKGDRWSSITITNRTLAAVALCLQT